MLSAVYKKQYSSMLLLVTVFDEICGSCEDTVNIETIRLKPSTADDTQNNFLSCGGPKSKKIISYFFSKFSVRIAGNTVCDLIWIYMWVPRGSTPTFTQTELASGILLIYPEATIAQN